MAKPKISLSAGTPVIEGTTGTYLITLDTQSPDALTVYFNTTGSTATFGTDYNFSVGEHLTAVTANSFTIAAGQKSATLNIVAVSDAVTDPNETVSLTLDSGAGYQLAASDSSFAPFTNVSVGSDPLSVISADFNGDGKLDLATANSKSNDVSVRLGDGNGGFSGTTTVSVGLYPLSIISADFNGDSKLDLASVNGNSNDVSVRLGDGNGGFSGTTTLSAATSPNSFISSFISADFNNDGKRDLAAANSGSNDVAVLLGDGIGGFSGTATVPVGFNPVSVISADFNGDGKLDLATANLGSNDISVLLGDGSGGFSGTTTVPVALHPVSVISADFNGDSKLDLATANAGDNNVSVRLGDGSGGFSGTTAVPVGLNPSSVISADFNGDGKLDLATANAGNNNVSVRLGDGSGGFSGTTTLSAGTMPSSVISADFNGDGRLDLAATNYTDGNVSVLLNTTAPTATLTLVDALPNSAPVVTAGAIIAFTEQTPLTVANAITITDANGDADWNGGSLKIQITGNNTADDGLALPTTNNGGIWLNSTGNVLMSNTTVIGSADAASVSNGTTWTLTFNAAATNALVQSTAQAIQFTNNSDKPDTTDRTITFTATDKNKGAGSATQTVTVTAVNDDPTLTRFASPVASGNEDSQINVTFDNLKMQGDEADVDDTVTAFVVTAVSSGTLKIGLSPETASPWNAKSNSIIDVKHQAYWTPAANANDTLDANGTLKAFTAMAKDEGGLESASSVQATVNVAAVPDVTVAAEGEGTAVEGGAVGTFTVTLDSPAPVGGLVVNYSLSGTATLDDYTVTAKTFTIAEGKTTATLDVAALSDTVTDPNDTVSLTLGSGDGYQLAALTNPTATLTLVDVTTAPTLISSSPTDNATTVAISSNIILTFSEAVQAGSGNILISNGTDTRTISVTDNSQVIFNGNTVTINPEQDLNAGGRYNVQMLSGVIKNLAGTDYTGISDAETLNFTTNTAPNTAPSATNINQPVAYTEDTTSAIADIVITDPDTNTLTATITLAGGKNAVGSLTANSGNGEDFNADTGIWTVLGTQTAVNDALASLAFVPSANGHSNTSASISISDGIAPAISGTLTFNGTGVNDAPTGTNKTITTLEDTPFIFSAADFGFADSNDSPANVLANVLISSLPTKGTLQLNGAPVEGGQAISTADIGSLKFIPAANANGNSYANFNFKVQDDGGTTANGGKNTSDTANTLTINVAAVPDVTVVAGGTAVEGGTEGTFTVTLDSAAPKGGLVVNYSLSGTATLDKDYTVTASTFTIAEGQTTATLNVAALSDTVTDPNETVSLKLDSGDGYQLAALTNPTATLTLVEPPNSAPNVKAGTITAFTEQTPLAVANAITINDANGDADWNGGSLKIQITGNKTVGDGLALPTTNNGGIWLNTTGNVLMSNTTEIGRANPASNRNGQTWTLTFNAEATNALVQSTAQAIKFTNNSDKPDTTARTVTFTATDKNGGMGFATQTVTVTAVNDAPTIKRFTAAVARGNEDSQLTVTFDNLKTQGDEADVDGRVTAFAVKAVSSGTLKIGLSAATATPWNASSNSVIDATHHAYWTPAANANGTLNAFTAVAKDDGGLESASPSPVQARVYVTAVPDVTVAAGVVAPVEGGTAGIFTVALDSAAPKGGLVVNYSLSGTATLSTDYTVTAGENTSAVTANTFTIAEGQTSATLNVAALSDAVTDPNETVSLKLGSGTGYQLAAASDSSFAPSTINLKFSLQSVISAAPQSVISADFNGDGRLDLATANKGSNSVSVFLGKDQGGFGMPANVQVGQEPISVTSADFNGDGKLDLATANERSNNVSVLLGISSGGFDASANVEVGKGPVSVISADFNGDGKLDLATANKRSNNVLVFLGKESGGFSKTDPVRVGSSPSSVISADFNSDGRLDLATANFVSYDVSVFLGKDEGGFGWKTNVHLDQQPISVISADFNGDGKLDLATANKDSNNVSVFLGKESGGFSKKTVPVSVGSSPSSVISADFNSDGKLDLATANKDSNNVSVLLGNGSGGFDTAAKVLQVGQNPYSVISADFNGDGRPDLATANSGSDSVSVLLNTSAPTATLTLVEPPNKAPVVTAGTTTGFTEQTPLAVASAIAINDVDGDADWNGGSLKIQITGNNTAGDGLALPTIKNSGIWLDTKDKALMSNTTVIGKANAASVSNDTLWTLTFNAAATNALVQSTAQAIKFTNDSDKPSTTDRTITFTATDKNNGAGSATQIVTVTAVNDAPTLTSFTSPVASGNEDSQITVTFDNLKKQGDEADVDGTVTAFVVKEVSSGALKIGSFADNATAWDAKSNSIIDAKHQAYWTPAANANDTLDAFTAVAKDDGGSVSVSPPPVQAKVNVAAVLDVTVAAVESSLYEGQSSIFKVTLESPAPVGGLVVNYSLSGTATLDDYTVAAVENISLLTTNTITIDAGKTTAKLQVSARPDNDYYELSETVDLKLGSGIGYQLATSGSATLTIKNYSGSSATVVTAGTTDFTEQPPLTVANAIAINDANGDNDWNGGSIKIQIIGNNTTDDGWGPTINNDGIWLHQLTY